jgi:hypothetical protein
MFLGEIPYCENYINIYKTDKTIYMKKKPKRVLKGPPQKLAYRGEKKI